jgi:hypothetical protein
MKNPELYIEALVFASEQSIRIEEILYCLQATFERDFTIEEVNASLAKKRTTPLLVFYNCNGQKKS